MPHDWTTLPLGAGGRSLIEASAGTGKTWTIAVLYLRLLLEQGLTPRAIVVTTFTEAAAQELRERLRRRLLWAEAHAALRVQVAACSERPGAQADDPALDWLSLRWHEPGQADRDLQALRLALAELEHAPVSTLHGLCRRILTEQPLEAGVDFGSAELVSTDSLLDEIGADLWRRLQQGPDDDVLQRLQTMTGKPLTLTQLRGLLKHVLMAGVEIEAPALPPSDPDSERLARPDAERAAQLQAVAGNATLFHKNSKLQRALDALARALDPAANPPARTAAEGLSLDEIDVLADARKLTAVSKLGKSDAELLAAVDLAARIATPVAARMQAAPQAFLHALAEAARTRADELLRLRRQQSFDSLLETVDAALAREAARASTHARPLADALFAQWPVALVDEFQDTDALQFGILDQLYRDANGRERGRLVMIGDPKQAIYRFRGGDIHAYRRAAEQIDEHLNLAVNQRSSTSLLAGCNQLFARAGEALSADPGHDIRYQPVQAAGRADATPYRVGDAAPAAALVLHCQADVPGGQDARRQAALIACASHIVSILNDPAQKIADRRLGPADLAVLLPRGADIARLRSLLEARGVPCVATSRDSVLAGDTARELQIVLHGVIHPGDAGALRAAAATRLWGTRFAEIQRWQDEHESLQRVALRFRALHSVLLERGVVGLIEALLEQIAARALSTRRGERLLTDLRHLGELLQEAAEGLGGPEELLTWLQHQREGAAVDETAADERQLRIESQQPRLRLLTLHASKGLEFPVVLLPLLWANGGGRDLPPWRYSDARAARPRLSYAEEAKLQQQTDLQDERFRLLYVALTRAVHACHVYAMDPQRPKRAGGKQAAHEGVDAAPLDVLLHRMFGARTDIRALLQEHQAQLDDIALCAGWPAPSNARYAGEPTPQRPRTARPTRPLPARVPEGKHSFTSLSRTSRAQNELPLDADAPAQDEALILEPGTAGPDHAVEFADSAHPELLALAGLRGASFGNALHAILELRAIGRPLLAQLDHVQATLAAGGLRARSFEPLGLAGFSERLAQRLDAALAAPLGLEQTPSLALADLAAADQRAELGFDFALPEIALADLAEACSRHGEPVLVPRSGGRVAGLMSGKIDLVFRVGQRFHVLDYKGNWLGERVSEYLGTRLGAHMDHSQYRFQALLYTLALDRYLQQRLGHGYSREAQLGECVYLFLRAAGLAPDAGMWRQRFAPALIQEAQAVLAGAWHSGAAA